MFETLEYLSLRETRIEKADEIAKLTSLPSLRTLILKGTPYLLKNKNTFFYELLNFMPSLSRINKTSINDRLREQTLNHYGGKYKKEQEARALAEKLEEEKLRKEAEEGENE